MTTNSRYNFSQMTRAITLLKSHLNNAVSSSRFSSSRVYKNFMKPYIKFIRGILVYKSIERIYNHLESLIKQFIMNIKSQSNKFCTTMKLPARYHDTLTEPSDKLKLIIQCSKLDYVEKVACILGMNNLVK
ncbi:hypothetical protein Rs2_05158 [Raphanus sativus]|nr:hypothetical protein Rs2_05158 [Raphanus sativus]